MQVGLAVARGVSVGVGVVLVLVGEGVAVGEVGEPFPITMFCSAKPGAGVGVAPLLPPPQLGKIAANTNNTTGATTINLSHRVNIKP